MVQVLVQIARHIYQCRQCNSSWKEVNIIEVIGIPVSGRRSAPVSQMCSCRCVYVYAYCVGWPDILKPELTSWPDLSCALTSWVLTWPESWLDLTWSPVSWSDMSPDQTSLPDILSPDQTSWPELFARPSGLTKPDLLTWSLYLSSRPDLTWHDLSSDWTFSTCPPPADPISWDQTWAPDLTSWVLTGRPDSRQYLPNPVSRPNS